MMSRLGKRTGLWTKYHRLARKHLEKAKEHSLELDLAWLESATEWIEKAKFVTDAQMGAIDNVGEAIYKMIAYRKLKAKREAYGRRT